MYSPIKDYAIIGDTRTAALVSSQGSIDWLCLPHFDSDAVFLRLLDDRRGGYCAVRPANMVSTARRYLPGTAILETTFTTSSGVLVATDFMPVGKRRNDHEIGRDTGGAQSVVRLFRAVGGSVEFAVEVRPTFSFGGEQPQSFRLPDGLVFRGRKDVLCVRCPGDFEWSDQAASISVRLEAGDSFPLILTYSRLGEESAGLVPEESERALEETRRYWEEWSSICSYEGEHRKHVVRSAITLKLLTFEPTGAIIAAPTTSLPEEIGGVRNWDYRFTWLRDSMFALTALLNLGYLSEAHDYMHFLIRTCECPVQEFQILYGIRGEWELTEKILEHLEGYRSSKPVRIGNAAAVQKQLDVYGDLLHCIHLYANLGGFERHQEVFATEFWPTVRSVADYVVRHWREPDSGIWEVRGAERHFVHSKALCWVALDRAIKLARFAALEPDPKWLQERDAVHGSLMHEGFNKQVGAFVQSYGSTTLDASVLRLPMLGVIGATDLRMRSTIEQIERKLVRNGLVYRYLESDDGLPGGEGTFAICTFWLINNYILQGRIQEAKALFKHVLSFANDLGLFSEEIDPVTGEHLGNFPQAFTHIALVNTAVRLATADAGKSGKLQTIVEWAGR